jgi:pseudouridine-5'-phosphate glycosidase
LLSAKRRLGLDGGVLVAVPIPEEHALPLELVEAAVAEGMVAAEAQGVRGKGLTPFLLSRVAASTAGRSLAANIALVENNAHVGARIALACAAAGSD